MLSRWCLGAWHTHMPIVDSHGWEQMKGKERKGKPRKGKEREGRKLGSDEGGLSRLAHNEPLYID